jgi:hypothetical protein
MLARFCGGSRGLHATRHRGLACARLGRARLVVVPVEPGLHSEAVVQERPHIGLLVCNAQQRQHRIQQQIVIRRPTEAENRHAVLRLPEERKRRVVYDEHARERPTEP